MKITLFFVSCKYRTRNTEQLNMLIKSLQNTLWKPCLVMSTNLQPLGHQLAKLTNFQNLIFLFPSLSKILLRFCKHSDHLLQQIITMTFFTNRLFLWPVFRGNLKNFQTFERISIRLSFSVWGIILINSNICQTELWGQEIKLLSTESGTFNAWLRLLNTNESKFIFK